MKIQRVRGKENILTNLLIIRKTKEKIKEKKKDMRNIVEEDYEDHNIPMEDKKSLNID